MSYLSKYSDNKIIDIQFDETGATEILSLEDLKAHLQITYTDDDTYLTDLITACRQALEKFCNISLVEKEITLFADYYCERQLPYGPIQSVDAVTLKTGISTYTAQAAGTDYEVDGITGGFQIFRPLSVGRFQISYTAGYGTVPKDLILDLKRICGYCYEHKGDEPLTSLQGGQQRPRGLDEALELFAGKHQRCCWI